MHSKPHSRRNLVVWSALFRVGPCNTSSSKVNQDLSSTGDIYLLQYAWSFLYLTERQYVPSANRYKENRLIQVAMCLAAIACGTRMIYVVNKNSWTIVMQQVNTSLSLERTRNSFPLQSQGPPLGTLWIYFIVQLPLLQAVLTLTIVASAVRYSGWKIIF